jgi:hypothetical protein
MMHATTGFLPRLRARLFGERDAVDEQLRDIARQGSGMSRLAQVCAFTLTVLFSLGSLVALGGDALVAILNQAPHGLTWRVLPDAITVSVSTLLVVCFDVGMVYAATMLRILHARRAPMREVWVHWAVLVMVMLLEASTYIYMVGLYERPVTLGAWGLVVTRGLAAPGLAVYLSMARTTPVGARDILYQAELASGRGLLRDVVVHANDPRAGLAEKMALYGASAPMVETDRARLDDMLLVVQTYPTRPPTGPGTPRGVRVVDEDSDPTLPALRAVPRNRRIQGPRGGSNPQAVRTASAEVRARAAWRPGMSVTQLQLATGMSRSTASRWRSTLHAEGLAEAAQ